MPLSLNSVALQGLRGQEINWSNCSDIQVEMADGDINKSHLQEGESWSSGRMKPWGLREQGEEMGKGKCETLVNTCD